MFSPQHTRVHTPQKNTRQFLEGVDMFSTLTVTMVSQVYAYVQIDQEVYIKWVQVVVYQLYQNKGYMYIYP